MSDLHAIPTQPPAGPTGDYTPHESSLNLARILDQYFADLQAGRAPDRAALIAAHPDLARELEHCLSGLDFVHHAGRASRDTPVQLGDYRIVREVGRGGMGVVYEAEQLSLHRRVALKVLRIGGVADTEAMQRFQREAETVARLHHTNIVPIFAVGCENGVHYYAMQFIEGRSLGALLEERHGAPLTAAEVATFGLQAAEALAHAHQRGVIHRDVKPSNLLLDPEGVLWLTDFGLARRADEVTLTVAGAIMGTPRYMSPEQAAGVKQPIDHRTDIYSLGATLYELATGKPVFQADSPAGVISQILVDEPVAPRHWQEQLPRDLETIVLKCLAKEPARRYATAQALADDLRAFHDGRPIQARRPPFLERSARWVRKHRRSAALMGIAAAAAALLVIAGLMGLEQYRQSQLGWLYLSNEGQILTGELLDENGQSVQPRFTVPTEEPLALPTGQYQLRLRGRGFLDETYQVRIERGKEWNFEISLAEQRLWEPIAVEKSYDVVRMAERHDVLALSAAGVTRRHGGTGAVLWTTNLGAKDDPKLAGFRWDWDLHSTPSGRNDDDRRPRLLQPAPDLDHDGTPDLVWGSRRQAAVLAVSGKTGKVLWCYQAPTPTFEPNSRFANEYASTGVVLGIVALPDIDGDGVPDLVATCASQQQADGSVPRWLQALSGHTGKSLWRYDLDPAWFAPPGGVAPYDSIWNNTQGIASSMSSGIQSAWNLLYEKDWLHSGGGVAVPYPAEVVPLDGRPAVILAAGAHLVGLDPATGQPLWPAHDLGFWPLRSPQLADLEGAGHSDVLLLAPGDEGKEKGPAVPADPRVIEAPNPRAFLPPELGEQVRARDRNDDRLKLVALALTTRKLLWETPFRGYWGWSWFQEPFTWPVIADLDNDGKPEIIVPTGDFEGDTKWSGVQVLDGATGTVRWLRKLSRSSRFGQVQQVNRILVGPKQASDGARAVITAVLDGELFPRDQPYSSFHVGNFDKDYMHPVLLLDALSGKDGHSVWWARQRMSSASLTTAPKPSVGPLHWLGAGADGSPQFVVPYVPGSPQGESQRHTVYFVSSHSGKVLHVGADYREMRTLDLDGDGVLDLLAFRPDKPDGYDQGGKLETIRGRSPEAWRRLGGYWQLAGDLDGDGIPDLVTAKPRDFAPREGRKEHESNQVGPSSTWAHPESMAISGRDGHLLWQREINDHQRHTAWEETIYARLQPLGPGGDLNGDGVPDLLVTGRSNCNFMREGKFSPLLAVSGRTGQRLWEADIAVEIWNGPQLLECRDLDGDGQPEVVFVAAMDWGWNRPPGSRSSDDWQYWLAVLSGRDGTVRWRQPLCDRGHSGVPSATVPFSCVYADLDGDGILDVIIEAGAPGADGEVRAFRGKDGALLWGWVPEQRPVDGGMARASRPTLAVGDLDGDGHPEIVVLHTISVRDEKGQPLPYAEVVTLDGATGQPKWRWRESVAYDYNDTTNGAVRSHVTPLIVNLDGGPRRAVCVWTYGHEKRGQIVLLDAAGKELLRQPVNFRLNGKEWTYSRANPNINYTPYYGSLFRVWAVDLDGDGTDELVHFTTDKLRVTKGGLDKVLWEWPLPDEDCELLEVSPRTEQHPPLLVVRAGGRVLFLSSASEKPLWSCAGSGKPLAVAWTASGPRVISELEYEATVCRIAQSSFDNDRPEPPVTPSDDDPRFVQPLPWCPLSTALPLMPSSPLTLMATLLGIAVAVLILPGAVLIEAVRRRAWSWCVLPVLWLGLVVGGAYLLFLARLESEAKWEIFHVGEGGFAWRIGLGLVLLGLAGLPAVMVVATVGVWLRQRRWVRLAVLLISSLVLAALVGWTWLAVFAEPLGPEQRYSWRGWYAIWPAGAYAAGAVILVGFLLARTIRAAPHLAGVLARRVRTRRLNKWTRTE
jgi:outer membrane protein assembly factor BamB